MRYQAALRPDGSLRWAERDLQLALLIVPRLRFCVGVGLRELPEIPSRSAVRLSCLQPNDPHHYPDGQQRRQCEDDADCADEQAEKAPILPGMAVRFCQVAGE